MSLETLLNGFKHTVKAVSKYASITVLALSNYSCSDDFTGCQNDNDCRMPRICNTETNQCEEQAGNGGYDVGNDAGVDAGNNDPGITPSVCDNLPEGYLICEDFREGPGIFSEDHGEWPDGIYNYGSNGVEIIDGGLYIFHPIDMNEYGVYALDFRWRTGTASTRSSVIAGFSGEGSCSPRVFARQITNSQTERFGFGNDIVPPSLDIQTWHKTRIVFSASGEVFYVIDDSEIGSTNQDRPLCDEIYVQFESSEGSLMVDYTSLEHAD